MNRRKVITVVDVADRLEQAAHTLKRLPKIAVQGYFGTWPSIVREAIEAYGWDDAHIHPGPPSPRHITEMDEALRWLMWLEVEEVKLVWLRAYGIRWKSISKLSGWSVRKLQHDWRIALVKIAHRLANPTEKFEFPYKRIIRNG